jgi:hypothetical protein
MKPTRTEYVLTLRPEAGNWRTPGEQRLRAALKRLLRTYGLRCTRCAPAEPEASQAQPKASHE